MLLISGQPLLLREKLLAQGATALSDAELLAIFLRTGTLGTDALSLAERLISHFGGLKGVFEAELEDFATIKGVGPVKYGQIQAILEMARRYFWHELQAQPKLDSACSAGQFLQSKMQTLEREVFSCIFLNSQHRVIDYAALFWGTVNQAAVYPREIAKAALQRNATALILAHNHPSGDVMPSKADKTITGAIIKAMQLLDISVLDHFIIGEGKPYSFVEAGLI